MVYKSYPFPDRLPVPDPKPEKAGLTPYETHSGRLFRLDPYPVNHPCCEGIFRNLTYIGIVARLVCSNSDAEAYPLSCSGISVLDAHFERNRNPSDPSGILEGLGGIPGGQDTRPELMVRDLAHLPLGVYHAVEP